MRPVRGNTNNLDPLKVCLLLRCNLYKLTDTGEVEKSVHLGRGRNYQSGGGRNCLRLENDVFSGTHTYSSYPAIFLPKMEEDKNRGLT